MAGAVKGGRARAPWTPEVRISKALSYTLRHGAAKEGLTLRGDGYANVAELLAMSKFQSLGLTFEVLQKIVRENDKQRFTLTPITPSTSTSTSTEDLNSFMIRANQGHSIALSSEALNLTPLLPGTSPDFPEKVVHGTFYAFYPLILRSGGLKRMGRTHIHFSSLTAYQQVAGEGWGGGGVLSGMRKDADVVFVVDAKRAVESGGCRFWRSANGVVLTEGNEDGVLGLEFVDRVEDRRGRGVLWENGKVLVELPESLMKRSVPRGKEFLARQDGGGKGKGKKGRGKGKEAGKEEVKEVKVHAGDV